MPSGYSTNLASFKKANTFRKFRTSPKFTDSIMIDSNTQEFQNNFDDINFITKAFYVVLCMFSNRSHSRQGELTRKVLECTTTVILAYANLGGLYSTYKLIGFIPMGIPFSDSVSDSCSFIVRILLLYKKKSIMSTMKFINESYTSLQKKHFGASRLKLSIAFIACFIVPATEYINTGISCYFDENVTYLGDLFFGWKPKNYRATRMTLLFVDAITMNQLHALPGFIVVLCCHVFSILRNFVVKFSLILKQQNDSKVILYLYVKYSRIIYECIEKIEDSFSILLVFVYAYMTCSIFCAATILIRVSYEINEAIIIIQHFIIIIVDLFAFFFMSFKAASINDAAVQIKQTICELVARTDTLDHKQRNLLLAMASDFPTRVVVTGWGLFTLYFSLLVFSGLDHGAPCHLYACSEGVISFVLRSFIQPNNY